MAAKKPAAPTPSQSAPVTEPPASSTEQATPETTPGSTTESTAPGTDQQPTATTSTTTTEGQAPASAPAPAPAPAPGEPAAPAGTDKQPEAATEIEGVYVRATMGRRCRAGFCFDQDGQGFAKGVLSDEQLAALEADPLLKVEHCTFTPAE